MTQLLYDIKNYLTNEVTEQKLLGIHNAETESLLKKINNLLDKNK